MLEAKRSNNAEEMKSALEEACTMICVGGENFVRNLEVHEYIEAFLVFLPEQSTCVLAMRGIATLADCVPKACPVMIAMDIIPTLVKYLKRESFLVENSAFTEELLKTVSILSLESHETMLRSEALTALVLVSRRLPNRLKLSSLQCVMNFISVSKPRDIKQIEDVLPMLGTLLEEQFHSESLHFTGELEVVKNVGSCFAYAIDRLLISETASEKFFIGPGGCIIPSTVRLFHISGTAEVTAALRKVAVGVLSAVFLVSPLVALKEFSSHHVFQSVLNSLMSLITPVEESISFESLETNDRSQATAIEHLPLLSNEHQCIPLLEFLLLVLPRAPETWDEGNITLPRHSWQWEDDFHNRNEYEEDQAEVLEEEYQKQRSTRRFFPFEILHGSRTFSVNFEHMRFLNSHGDLSRPFFRGALLTGFYHRRPLMLMSSCPCDGNPSPNVAPSSAPPSDPPAPSCFSACWSRFCSQGNAKLDDSPSDVKNYWYDAREHRVLHASVRLALCESTWIRLLLSTCVPTLLSVLGAIVTYPSIRHASVLLLRCMSLTMEFITKTHDIAPKALELLVHEIPTIVESLSTIVRNIPHDIATHFFCTYPLHPTAMLPGSATVQIPNRYADTFLSVCHIVRFLMTISEEKTSKAAFQHKIHTRLTVLPNEFQSALDLLVDVSEPRDEVQLIFAVPAPNPPIAAQEQPPNNRNSCPMHSTKVRYLTDTLAILRSINRSLNTCFVAPQLLRQRGKLREPIGNKSCWEILLLTLGALSTDEVTLEDFHIENPTALRTLLTGLQQSRARGDLHWIPQHSIIHANNFVTNIARRLGAFAEPTPDTYYSDSHRTSHSPVPLPLQSLEERLVRPLSIKIAPYNVDASPPNPQTFTLDGVPLKVVPVIGDFDDQLFALPFATISSLEKAVFNKVKALLNHATDVNVMDAGGWYPHTSRQLFENPAPRPNTDFHVLLFIGGVPLREPAMTTLDALTWLSPTASSLRALVESPPSQQRNAVSKAVNTWLTQHVIHFLIVETPPPPLRKTPRGCSCIPNSGYLCTPMHIYENLRMKNEENVATLCLEILHLLTPALRRPSQIVPGALRKMYSCVVQNAFAYSLTFLLTSLAPLGHPVVHSNRLEVDLPSYALWNFSQVFPLQLRRAVFMQTLITATNLALKAAQTSLMNHRSPVVGAEWMTTTGHIQPASGFFGFSALLVNNLTLPKKLKVTVSRENIIRDAQKVFETHAAAPLPFDVEFKDEPGSGLGPTLEFFHVLGRELQKHSGLWLSSVGVGDGVTTDLGVFPAWPLSTEKIKLFELLGSVCGRALREHRHTCIKLHTLFWRSLLGEDLLQEASFNFALLDSQMESSLRHLVEMSASELNDAGLAWVVPGTEIQLVEGEEQSLVTKENVELYAQAVRNHFLVRSLTEPVTAFWRGIQKVFSPCHLRLFSAEELQSLLYGVQGKVWAGPSQLADDIICDHGYSMSSKPVRYLIETVGRWNEEWQRKFLLFISGSDSLPIGGLNPKITVVRRDVDDPKPGGTPHQIIVDRTLPTVNTCFHYLKLPEYSSMEVIQARLFYAVSEGQNSFALS
jgi:hypothetical protein